MSENRTVSSLRSPPSFVRAGSASDAIDDRAADVLREHRAQVRLLAALGREPADRGGAEHEHREHARRGDLRRSRRARTASCASTTYSAIAPTRDQRRHPRATPDRAAAARRSRSPHRSERARAARARRPREQRAVPVSTFSASVAWSSMPSATRIERRLDLVVRGVREADEHELAGERARGAVPASTSAADTRGSSPRPEHVERQRCARPDRQRLAHRGQRIVRRRGSACRPACRRAASATASPSGM